MPRNKYPEETEKKIIDKAFELFLAKGYENTSVQDIIDATALSKGAIYHHFDSKESILLRVYDRISERTGREMMKIVKSKEMNGREKINAMFMNSFKDEEHIEFMKSMPNLLDNPHFLALHMKETMEDIVPKYIYPVLQQGNEDGSICCKHPLEAAHALMALSNVWMNPLIYVNTDENINNKVEILNRIMSALGIELKDQKLDTRMKDVMDALNEQ